MKDLIFIKELNNFVSMLQVILTLFLIKSALCINTFQLRKISNKTTNAKCLDGSQYGFYVYSPEDFKPQGLLIYFQQTSGIWCAQQDLSSSIENCAKWTDSTNNNYIYGSSVSYGTVEMILNGILSPQSDGIFANWAKVLMKSCDGGYYFGNKSIEYKKGQLHFRGSENIKQSFKQIKKQGLLDNKKQIVIAGAGNGGIAALSWAQQLKMLTITPIKILVDAVIYLNAQDHKNQKKLQKVIQNRAKSVEKLVLSEGAQFPNLKCAEQNMGGQWRCLFVQNLIAYFPAMPIFFTQSLYDGHYIKEVLGFSCAQQFVSLTQCQKRHKKIIQDYYENVTVLINKMDKEEITVFGIACVAHQFTTSNRWNSPSHQVPENSGNSVTQVVSAWVKNGKTKNYIDPKPWPSNSVCAHKFGSKNLKEQLKVKSQ